MTKIEDIYEAAKAVFMRYGAQKASMQEIADVAGVSKKTLYNHFGSKADLFHRMTEWDAQRAVQFYNEIQSDGSLMTTERLIRAINFTFQELHGVRGAVLADLLRCNPYLNDTPMNYVLNNLRSALSRLLEDAQTEGLCRIDFSADEISLIVLSMISGLFSWETLTEFNGDDDRLASAAMGLILDGLLTAQGHEALAARS